MTVYLLHLDRPFAVIGKGGNRYETGQDHPTQHYLGFTNGGLRKRLEAHAAGRGGRMLRVALDRGVGFELVRTWPGGDRSLERYLKKRNGLPTLCPVCSPGTKAALHVDTTVELWPAKYDPDGTLLQPADVRRVYFDRPKVRRPIRFRAEGREVVEDRFGLTDLYREGDLAPPSG